MPGVHRVFVVHRHEDDVKITDLKDLFKGKDVELKGKEIEVCSLSIAGDNLNDACSPNYIGELLKLRIELAGKIIVLITPDTESHEWVNWPVRYAEKLGKRIIGVWAYGSVVCEVPDALNKYADAMVGWDAGSILQALEGKRLWQNPDCTQRGSQPISRVGCS